MCKLLYGVDNYNIIGLGFILCWWVLVSGRWHMNIAVAYPVDRILYVGRYIRELDQILAVVENIKKQGGSGVQ